MRSYKHSIILLLLLLLFPGCGQAADSRWVAVLFSNDAPVLTEPFSAFQAGMGNMEVRSFTLHDEITADSALMEQIMEQQPSLILALGAKAAYLAKLWTKKRQEIPVLFAMVLHWEQYNLLEGQNNIAGISSEVEPGNQFLSLSMFAPGAKRIGVIYNPAHSGALIARARTTAALLGLELVEQPITNEDEFQRNYRQIASKVDSIWALNDPTAYTLENMDWLTERCIRDRLVCIGQGVNQAQAGMMLTVRADISGIGAQAASMARNILDRQQSPAAAGVMPPLGTHISLNRRTAERIGLLPSAQALTMVTEVIE